MDEFYLHERQTEVFDYEYAVQLKTMFPEIWDMAGGSYGDNAFFVLSEIVAQDGYALTPEQADILKLRDSWVSRHKNDHTLAGVVAQVKWLAIGQIGEKSMKKLIATQTDIVHQKRAKNPLKSPKGGLTAAGRAHYKRTEGANLKPGVTGAADTPQKMRRKGSFLTRFFTNPSGPMKDENGKPTRLALSAAAWGEPVPQNTEDAAALAAKGRRMLERYQAKKDNLDESVETKGGEKPFWETPLDGKRKTRPLSDEQKAKAKARAKRAGRKYPNLVDNAWAARKQRGNND
jgi:hypothetical protein